MITLSTRRMPLFTGELRIHHQKSRPARKTRYTILPQRVAKIRIGTVKPSEPTREEDWIASGELKARDAVTWDTADRKTLTTPRICLSDMTVDSIHIGVPYPVSKFDRAASHALLCLQVH